ncbi:EAL domain-containing protein [Methyloferula stellata]|uniref:EAL domain-containing protein n=1 Tax=Methyloferula stellata TaxID=876270 RepID=UPI001FCAB957|nr:EAL domain-containing protein [Methyloferula stellata]
MAFQPIVDVVEHRIVAHEALVRGTCGEPAGTVLAQVNDDNLYAFDQACRVKAIELAAELRLEGDLSINFLPNAVYDPEACIRLTLDAARRTKFPLERITFEFTENEEIIDTAHILNIIGAYRGHGFKISLDDFGIGYSHLARLVSLRPDSLKIDRELVKDCDQDKTRLAVLASLVSLGADTGIKIIAEGVERVDEVEALRGIGLRFMQGFYFAKPVFEGVARDAEIYWPDLQGAAPV